MARPDLPGNFAMIFSIATGPSGVCAVNASEIISQPRIARRLRINERNFRLAGEPEATRAQGYGFSR